MMGQTSDPGRKCIALALHGFTLYRDYNSLLAFFYDIPAFKKYKHRLAIGDFDFTVDEKKGINSWNGSAN